MTSIPLDFQRRCERRGPMANGPKYSCAAIREAWEREAKQRWDSRTHGRGLSLLIVKMLTLMPSTPRSPIFEFWRDQNKIRGRFIGADPGNGVVVARLDQDGTPIDIPPMFWGRGREPWRHTDDQLKSG
jgi:hypothetical protein